MKMFRILIGATALASTTLMTVLPTSAFAQDRAAYEHCVRQDRNNQLAGTLLGGLLGGLVGNKIDSGKGTVIGGATGAFAGNRIANQNCEVHLRTRRTQAFSQSTNSDVFYDQRSGRYIDHRSGAFVANPNARPSIAASLDRKAQMGGVHSRPHDLIPTTDQNGRTIYVSQRDYDRYYR